jgi:hypothetical protein
MLNPVVNFDQPFAFGEGTLPPSQRNGAAPMQRRRFKNILTFPDRLAKEADRFRHEAETKPPGQEETTF